MKSNSLKAKFFTYSAIYSIIIIIIFSFFVAIMFYHLGINNANTIIQYKNKSIKYFIRGYVIKVHSLTEFLSKNYKICNALTLSEKDKKEILDMYQSLKNINNDIKYIYSGYKNGYLLINDYTPPDNYNSVYRPWYQAAIKSKPNISYGLPYQDIKDKEWLISASKVLIDSNNEVSGVLGIDSSIDDIVHLLTEYDDKFKSMHSYIVDRKGNIIIHKNKKFLQKNLNNIIHVPIDFTTKKSGKFEYTTIDNIKRLGCFNRIDNVGWIVITEADKKEIIAPIAIQISYSIAAIIIFSVLLGWLSSNLLSNEIVFPLIKLKNRVNAIIKGEDTDNTPTYKYPNNEIGTIALDIEEFTTSELYNKNMELQEMNKQLELLSVTDQLTNLFTRRKFFIEMEKEWNRYRRYGNIFSIIMFDIDWFKKINDTFGHQIGDAVLKDIAYISKRILRKTDIISRWGGEEFMILCPETDLENAKILAEKLRIAVATHKFPMDKQVTISIGISKVSKNINLNELLKKVDDKLYLAKNSGRNTIAL